MATKKELTKEQRIEREKKRLRSRYKNLPADTLTIVQGLIDEAAFMCIELDSMKKDMLKDGRVEMFTQSDKTEPYERERPVVRQYAQMVRNYQNILKQLDEKLPKEPLKKEADDGFEDFAGI